MVSSCSLRSCRILVSRNILELSFFNIDPERESGTKHHLETDHFHLPLLLFGMHSSENGKQPEFRQSLKRKAEEKRLASVFVWTKKSGRRKITHDSSWKCSFVETNTAFIMKYTVDAQQKDEINFSSRFDDLLFVQSAVCCRWKLSPCYYNSFLLLSASI